MAVDAQFIGSSSFTFNVRTSDIFSDGPNDLSGKGLTSKTSFYLGDGYRHLPDIIKLQIRTKKRERVRSREILPHELHQSPHRQ